MFDVCVKCQRRYESCGCEMVCKVWGPCFMRASLRSLGYKQGERWSPTKRESIVRRLIVSKLSNVKAEGSFCNQVQDTTPHLQDVKLSWAHRIRQTRRSMNLGSSSQLRIGLTHRVAHPPPEFKDGAQLCFDSSLRVRVCGRQGKAHRNVHDRKSLLLSSHLLLVIIVGQSDPSTASSMALLHLSCSDQREVMNQCPNVRHWLQSFLGLLLRGTFRIVFLRKDSFGVVSHTLKGAHHLVNYIQDGDWFLLQYLMSQNLLIW